jgi:coproporphyrinogen III oxidase
VGPSVQSIFAADYHPDTHSRYFATTPSGPGSNEEEGLSNLFYTAATGFAAGLVFVVANRWRASADSVSLERSDCADSSQGDIKCDGAPAIDVIDSHGEPWYPADAYEQDDPQVSHQPCTTT